MGDRNQARLVEKFVVIWLDSNLDIDDANDTELQQSMRTLGRICNTIRIFNRCHPCINFIRTTVRLEKIFLIVSGSLGELFVPQIEMDPKINSIYIFCSNRAKHETWARKERHPKIQGIFTQIERLCYQLNQDTKQCEHETISMQLLNTATNTGHSNMLDSAFIYSKLFKEILIGMNQDERRMDKAKEDFVKFCRIQYANNPVELNVIEEFRRDYSQPSPIWWYTRECFVYSMLNRAVETDDIDILLKMGFVICDLHQHLRELYMSKRHPSTLIVYRGQGISHEAFEHIKQNQGGLISFTNFLTTTVSREISFDFAQKSLENPNKIAVLFEMKIDTSIESSPFASLNRLSYFQEEYEQILFAMHTIFRIDHIEQLNERLWHVHLTLINGDDEHFRQLIEQMRHKLIYTDGQDINIDPGQQMCKLLINRGEFDRACDVYQHIIDNAKCTNDFKLARTTHFHLAEAFDLCKNDKIRALEQYKQVLDIHIDGDDEDIEQLNKALQFYLEQSSPIDYQWVAERYNHIGQIQKNQNKLSEALISYEQALNIGCEHLSPADPLLTTIYSYIGEIYFTMKNYPKALKYFGKVIDLLPVEHPNLAETHFQMASVLECLNRPYDASRHAQQAVDICKHTLKSSNHSNRIKYQEKLDQLLLITSSDELEL